MRICYLTAKSYYAIALFYLIIMQFLAKNKQE